MLEGTLTAHTGTAPRQPWLRAASSPSALPVELTMGTWPLQQPLPRSFSLELPTVLASHRPGPALPCPAPARPLACGPNPGAVWTPSGLHCAQPNVNPAISPGPTRRLGRLLRLPAIQAASVPSRPWRTVSSRLLSPLSPYSYPAVGGGRQHRGPSTGSLARKWGRRVLPRALST